MIAAQPPAIIQTCLSKTDENRARSAIHDLLSMGLFEQQVAAKRLKKLNGRESFIEYSAAFCADASKCAYTYDTAKEANEEGQEGTDKVDQAVSLTTAVDIARCKPR